MSRAIVFNGDETWELRDLPVPDPQPGGAVLRVEATGLCHSDGVHLERVCKDRLRGRRDKYDHLADARCRFVDCGPFEHAANE